MTLAPDIVRLADANLLEAMREHARWQDPCVFQEKAGLILCAGATAHPGAFKNCVARIVTLQASPFGEPIYRRMGYTVCDRIKWFRFPAPTPT